jgi:tripartite-type tricarboxylate transporter receptor subunit TctC
MKSVAPALLTIAALLAVAFSAPTAARTDYPNRSVQLIVPDGAGGVADTGMRILTEQLTGLLKQPFVVENRPGAGGIIAAKTGASAVPDGYTLLMTGNNGAISTGLFKALPYDILADSHHSHRGTFHGIAREHR